MPVVELAAVAVDGAREGRRVGETGTLDDTTEEDRGLCGDTAMLAAGASAVLTAVREDRECTSADSSVHVESRSANDRNTSLKDSKSKGNNSVKVNTNVQHMKYGSTEHTGRRSSHHRGVHI
jgi:hypothetical protein